MRTCAKRGLLTDNGVDASELLEDLDTTSNEETSPRLDGVASHNVLPPCLAGVLVCDRLGDDGVQALYFKVAQIACSLDTCQHGETLVRTVMCCEPARRLWDYEEQTQDGEHHNALQDCWDSPRVACSMAGEGVVDPVDDGDTEVESRKLRANVHATTRLGTKLGLQDRYCRVDESKADSGDDTAYDEMCASVSGCLENGTNYADDGTDADTLATAKLLSYESSDQGTDEATDLEEVSVQYHHLFQVTYFRRWQR